MAGAKKIKIAVVFGGRSGEHEVSLVSASSVIKALDPKKYEILEIGITKKGQFLHGKNTLENFKKGATKSLHQVLLSFSPDKRGFFILNPKLVFCAVDVVFPVLHGPYGEDGTIQGMLEMAGLPYVGCGVLSSAASMDKFMTKIIFSSYGLPQAEFAHFTRDAIENRFDEAKKIIIKKIGLPCFVKPSNMGSSVGISKVKKNADLKKALTFAANYDSSILVEKAIDAREIECAVLGNDKTAASVAGEIIPCNEFYDYSAKYVDNASKLMIPAKLAEEKQREVRLLALAAYKALHCSGMARVDFLMDKKTGALYLNEINTIPGFTSISMYPKLWEATGIKYEKLVDALVKLAFERHVERQKNKTAFDAGDWYK